LLLVEAVVELMVEAVVLVDLDKLKQMLKEQFQ
jgi:hypothetical protein